jgi:hypothetical protein
MKDGLLDGEDDEEADGHDELSPGIVQVYLVLLLDLLQHLQAQFPYFQLTSLVPEINSFIFL